MKTGKKQFIILAAFACIYFVWGSTFLGIKYALETIPPFIIGAARFLFAGAVLLALSTRLQERTRKLDRKLFMVASFSGVLMAALGNGFVTWGEQKVDSGVAALWIATVPVWVLVLNWFAFEKVRPNPRGILGALLGLFGIYILSRGSSATLHNNSLPHVIALIIAALVWSLGTLMQKKSGNGGAPFRFAAIQMLAGGVALLLLATLNQDWSQFSAAAVSTKSMWATAYLSVIGTIITFTAYSWLVNVVSPTKVSTYALVNPLIALFVGSFLGHEILVRETYVAAALVLAGVALIIKSYAEETQLAPRLK